MDTVQIPQSTTSMESLMWSALDAFQSDNVVVVQNLIDSGLDIHYIIHGKSLLCAAMQVRAHKCAALLIALGLNVNGINAYGETCIGFLSRSKQNYSTSIHFLYNLGGNINICGQNIHPPLVSSCIKGKLSEVQTLISLGAKVNRQSVHKDIYCYPLLQTVVFGKFDVMKLLLEAGAKVNVLDRCGSSALVLSLYFHPSKSMRKKYVPILLQHGININVFNCQQCSAFVLSIVNNDVKLAENLLQLGCHVKNGSGEDERIARNLDIVSNPVTSDILNVMFWGSGSNLRLNVKVVNSHPILSEILEEKLHINLRTKCRLLIRKQLQYDNVNLIYKVDLLPLPRLLKKFLVYDYL